MEPRTLPPRATNTSEAAEYAHLSIAQAVACETVLRHERTIPDENLLAPHPRYDAAARRVLEGVWLDGRKSAGIGRPHNGRRERMFRATFRHRRCFQRATNPIRASSRQ
jgi:hypothetical protein